MLSVLRRAVAVAAVAAFSAGAVEAQFGSLKVEEIRMDVASFVTVDGTSCLTLAGPLARCANPFMAGPSALAVGIYLNDKIAIEPTLMFSNFSPDGGDATNTIAFGVFVPYYFGADRGHNGVFVAPGLTWGKTGDADAFVDFGADVGYKKAMNDNVSWRAAAVVRTGDSTGDEMLVGATFGFSVFWR